MTMRVELIDEPVSQQGLPSRWPKRVSWLVVCLTFPLIWVGGLVTTTDAGMAVPDWPTTFGYNMFLYPWYTWILGPWELFIEIGHRLLGSVVGMVSIALVIVVLKKDHRPWMRKLVVIALLAVIAQGILGGLRVRENEVLIAMLHGCTGPVFFALSVVIANAFTVYWNDPLRQCETEQGGMQLLLEKPLRLVTTTTVLVYFQLILGASIRHIPVTASTQTFSMLVIFHLIMALAVTGHVIAVVISLRKRQGLSPAVHRPAKWLMFGVLLQVGLGIGTWIFKYGWPMGLGENKLFANHLLVTYSWSQSHVTTAHAATGSLLLIFCVVLTTRLRRLKYVLEQVGDD